MPNERSVGDEIPADCEVIEVRVTQLKLLFNPIDPSPPSEKDLEPRVEEFILAWARSAKREACLALQIFVGTADSSQEASTVGTAVRSLVDRAIGTTSVGALIRETLVIGGWVAMWRPLEIFLYDWWPIRAERKLYDRLSVMPARVTFRDAGSGS